MLLPVLVERWQQECCGGAFAIGDRVAWGLAFRLDDKTWPAPGELVTELEVEASRPEHSPIVLTAGPLTLYWSAPDEHAGTIQIRGVVYEDHHAGVPEDGIRIEGAVRRIRVLAPDLDGDHRLTDVGVSPKAFSRNEIGLLVDLEIDGQLRYDTTSRAGSASS